MWIAAILAATVPARAETTPAPPQAKAPVEADPPLGEALRRRVAPDSLRPPPLQMEYAQYGVAITSAFNLSAGGICGADVKPPCIIGGGGGLVIRGGYRSPGPWYFGGAYEFIKMDSSNLYRLGVFQQLRGEVRYVLDVGSRAAPYVTGGLGAVVYGNEWQVQTGGAAGFAGAGVTFEVSRLALIGLQLFYRPALIAGWTDTAGIVRPVGLAQFVGLELQLEVRSEIGRR